MRRYDASGAPLGDAVQVNAQPSNNCSTPSVVPLAGGQLAVAYWSYLFPFMPGFFPGQCLVRTFDAAGNGSAVNSLGDADSCTATALPDSGFALVLDRPHYVGGPGIFLRRFDAAGAQLGDEAFIDGTPRTTTLPGFPYAAQPGVATLPDGNLAITWVRDGAVVAQKFTASGVAVADRFQVAASGTRPKIAGLSNGALAVTWFQSPTGTDEIWSQSFSATGATRDDAVRVASFARPQATAPRNAIAASSSGRYITSWGEPASGGGLDVFIARR